VDAHINYLLYGSINNLPVLANRLAYPNPDTRIEQFASLKLSPATVVALGDYLAAWPTPSAAQDATLRAGILDDFNKIVVGPAIWDGDPTVRFQGVILSPATLTWLGTANTAMQNRSLLRDSFVQYVPGMLDAAAASALTDNANGLATPTLGALLLKAFDDVTLNVFSTPDPLARATMWPAGQVGFPGLYSQLTFVNVSLAQETVDQLQGLPLAGPDLTQLNQNLLRDAYKEYGQPAMYQEAQIRPDTVTTLSPLNAGAFDALMQRDLNVVIYGPSIWDNGTTWPFTSSKRFVKEQNGILPGSDLATLIASSPAQGTPACVRLNRLLLELAYNTELSKSVLAPYILLSVPSTTTEISAKTAWNLRETLMGLAFVGWDMTADFVNAGQEFVTPWTDAVDHHLRGGDLDGSNQVYLPDYNKLRIQWKTAGPGADIDGSGKVDTDDYTMVGQPPVGNWLKKGDDEVK
jgi:hypothetical protein